jgi:hypothetical protein
VISDELHQESTAALPVPAVEPTVRLEDSMATLVFSKYSLRTLHEEIGLLDRKLAHLLKYEEFQTDSARQQAAARIEHKRDLLVRSAQAMVEDGVEKKKPASLGRRTRAVVELGAEPAAAAV